MAGPSLAELRSMTEAELVERHDALDPERLVVNGQIRAEYVSELDRRAAARSARATTTFSIVAILIAIGSLAASVLVR